jgi:threonine-phosphate decarboxylase
LDNKLDDMLEDKLDRQSDNQQNNTGRPEPEKLVHGGDIYSVKEKFSKAAEAPEILDFSANLNPLGLPEGVKQAIIESVGGFDVYPDPLCRELVAGLARYEGIPSKWLICGNGAADIIYRTVIARKPKKAMVLAPTFAEYEEALCAVDCNVVYHELSEENGFQADEGLADALNEELDMLFLCNPNNPTGHLLTKDYVLKILKRCSELRILLVVDECFNDFLEEPAAYSVKEYAGDYDNLLILKAFTKIYAMAGLRLGYCITANQELLRDIRNAGQPWSVSVPAQTAGLRAMEEKEYLRRTKEVIRQERTFLESQLKTLGIVAFPSSANYLFLKDSCPKEKPLHELLLDCGILIRNCDNYRGIGPGYYRICIKTHEENLKLIEALRKIKG